jgi:uncharacterized protein (DUF2336 family)
VIDPKSNGSFNQPVDPSASQAAEPDVMGIAEERQRVSQRVIAEHVVELFISDEGRLTERERSLMEAILTKLIHNVEMQVRQDLAKRLSALETAPRALVLMLANDEIAVARPLLMASPILRDPDLIEIVKHRSQEHLLAVALRRPLSSSVTAAIVDHGDEHVLEQLLKNGDAVLSRRAFEYLVAESRQVDQFQEPLLERDDLPPDLAYRMFWWVSGALRQIILKRFDIDPALLDDMIGESTRSILAEPPTPTAWSAADRLSASLADAHALDDKFLVQALRSGRIAAFVGALARRCRLAPAMARRILLDTGGETLAIACRAINMDRATFSTIYLLSRQSGSRIEHPAVFRNVLGFFDLASEESSRGVLRYWRADREYLAAIAAMDQVTVDRTGADQGSDHAGRRGETLG